MFDRCLTWFRIQLEATVSNTSTLVRLREFAAAKRESFRKQSKIDSYFSRSSVANDSWAGNFLEYCSVELLSLFKPWMCCVFVCFYFLDLNVKNSVIRFFCLSVQISESIIPTRPDNRGSTVSQQALRKKFHFASQTICTHYKQTLVL